MVKAKNIYFSYKDSDRVAISDVSLEIQEELTALMGKNGSGKTTLLKLIAGLLDPKKGEVEVGKESFVGFVPENPEDGFFANTVREEVEFFPKNLDLNYKKRAEEALSKLDILELADRSPFTLSAGEMRKVSMASVLSGVQKLMVLDEPVKSLHRKAEREIGELLRYLKKSTTIILSTHNSDFAYEFADRVILLENGKILKDENAKSILSNRELCNKAGLEVPQIVEWAEFKGIDPPKNFEEALKIFREGDSN